MRIVFLSAVFCACFSVSAYADGRAFPPDHCSAGAPFMAWTGVDGSNTFCDSGQDILSSALLPGCAANQQVIFDGSKFVCEDKQAVPTCPDNQVLTFLSGPGFTCVNANATVPTCTANQFLTYSNGAFQCANVQQITIPECAANEVVTAHGGQLVCTPGSSGSGFDNATWYDMTAQRQPNVTYTNDAGHAIEVSVNTYSGATGVNGWSLYFRCSAALVVNGTVVNYSFTNGTSGAELCDATAIVPSGATYSLLLYSDIEPDIVYQGWHELR